MRHLLALRVTSGLRSFFVNSAIIEHNYKYYRPHNFHSFSIFPSPSVNKYQSIDNNEDLRKRKFTTSPVLSKSKDKEKKKKPGKPQKVDHNEINQLVNGERLTADFEKSIADLKASFVKHLTVRTATGSIEQVEVTFDGQEYLLQELVEVSRRPKTVILNAATFPQAIPQILEALTKSGMNLNPQQDGTTIFIPIPKVTKEHRENLSKNAKTLYLKHRDVIKDIRNREIRNLKKQPSQDEDVSRRVQTHIEALADQYIKEAEKMLETKQKELLGLSE